MKLNRLILTNSILLSIGCGFALEARAGFQYNARDLVFGFRQASGSSELTVNAGPAANFYNLPIGQTITVTNVTLNQLTNAFGGVNDLSWSAAADVRTNGDASYPLNTLWVISPRTDLNIQTTPWNRASQFSQGNPASKIDGIASGAVSYAGQQPTGPDNTATGVIVPAGNQYAYSSFIGSGNYAGTFQGSVEVITPTEFSSLGQPIRADFYQMKPGTGAASYLGFFEFKTNGVMTYTAGPSGTVLTPPTITSVQRSGNTSTISFTTSSGAHYSLQYTNSGGLTAPASTWPVSGAPLIGDGSVQSLSDTTADPNRFYRISVTP